MSNLLKDIISKASSFNVGAIENLADRFLGPDVDRNGMEEFRESLSSQGTQRTNRYTVQFFIPATLRSRLPNALEVERGLSLRCGEVQIPEKRILVKEATAFGTPYKIGDNAEFGSLTASFLLSKDHRELALFNMWQNIIHDHQTGRIGYYNEYVAPELRVYMLDVKNNLTYTFVFEEVYPTAINTAAVGNDKTDELSTMTVEFAFRRFLGSNQTVFNPLNPSAVIPDTITGDDAGLFGSFNSASKAFGSVTDNFERLSSVKDRILR